MTNRLTTLGASAVLLGAAMLLAGCGNPVEGFVKSATKGQVDLSGRSVPADFPKVVPLYSGQVTSGVAMGQDGDHIWNVIMTVPGPQVMPTIAAQLKKAGFTTQLATTIKGDHGSLIFDNKEYDVAVVLKHSGDTYTVDYAVSNNDD
jgi:predicted small secreted protein